jgi:hypothetical protein
MTVGILPQAIPQLGWQAHMRLGTRVRHRTARGQQANHVAVAIARDMAACIWAIAREVSIARSPRLGGRRRPVDGRQPRCGAILAGMKRRQETRGPRSRPVPDGRQSGGRQPTDSRVLNRRADGCLLCPWSREQSGENNAQRPSLLWRTQSPLTPEVIATLALTCRRKRERRRSGRWRRSGAAPC